MNSLPQQVALHDLAHFLHEVKPEGDGHISKRRPYPILRHPDGITINNGAQEVRVTALDLYNTPAASTVEEIRRWIVLLTGMAVPKIESITNNKPFVEKLNGLWREAIVYLTDALHIDTLPREIEESEIKSFGDVYEMWEKTSLSKIRANKALLNSKTKKQRDRGMGNLAYGPFYCALFKIAYALNELDQQGYRDFSEETDFIYEHLFDPQYAQRVQTVNGKNTNVRDMETLEIDREITGLIRENDPREKTTIKAEARKKTEKRAMAKLINKPDFNCRKSIPDPVGIRIEVQSKEQLLDAILFSLRRFNTLVKVKREKIIIENNALLQENEWDELQKQLEKAAGGIAERGQSTTNTNTAKGYQDIKMIVPCVMRRREDRRLASKRFSTEIQFVLPDNSNETGERHHDIYAAKSILAQYTRLFGSFPERYLKKIIDITHATAKEDGVTRDLIEQALRKVIIKLENGRWVHRSCERLHETGYLPHEVEIASDSHKIDALRTRSRTNIAASIQPEE